MRIESVLALFLISGSGCSLLAPSDSELSGDWGVGGQGGLAASGNGGQANDAGQADVSDAAGSESKPSGGAPDAGEGGSDAGPSAGKSAGGGTGGVAGKSAGGGTGGAAGAGVAKGGSGGTLGAAGAGGAGKVAGGGGTGAVAGAGVAKGGSGGTLGAAGANVGGAGKGASAGAGGAVSYCAAKPCVRGTCSEVTNGYKCTCPAGWGGTTCAVGSCSTLSCPASAPCRVPTSSVVAICYPSACVGTDGLCMAENADGSGDAVVIEGRNPNFAMLSGSTWSNRAKYFAYIDSLHGACACVFPQAEEAGTPLVIPLHSARTKTTGFGQSNSWPNPPTCTCP